MYHQLSNMQNPKKYTASLDQSTTTTKFSLYLYDGTLVDQQIVTHSQISEHEGWLEHDPEQILRSVDLAIDSVIKRRKNQDKSFDVSEVLGLGICNQRQTVVCWDTETRKPLHNAIVWCDSRTKDICQKFTQKYKDKFTKRTGLPVSTYFTLFKILWILDHVEGIKQKVKQNKVKFGTIDSWVTLHLTGKYVTDASNASRTHLMNLSTGKWDQQLLSIAQITGQNLPTILNSFEILGEIQTTALKGVQLSCILGDQQSSAFAHNLTETQLKITYGTGCFLLTNIGYQPQFKDGFVTTVMYQNRKKQQARKQTKEQGKKQVIEQADGKKDHLKKQDQNKGQNKHQSQTQRQRQSQSQRMYGYEISVECGGGTLNWARRTDFFQDYNQLNSIEHCKSQLYFMPAFGSIFSPFWKSNVQGGLIGLTFKTQRKQILRAILDSITYRLYDNIKNQSLSKITKIIVDGGMTVNKQFMQMQADTFNKVIEVRTLDTCWGVAKGVLKTNEIEIKQLKNQTVIYKPNKEKHQFYLEKYEKWASVRDKFYGWSQ